MRRIPDNDDEDDDDDINSYEEYDDDTDDAYVPCPHCGETMLEAADHCPACNRWITSEDLPNQRQPWWIVVVILILLATIVMSILPI